MRRDGRQHRSRRGVDHDDFEQHGGQVGHDIGRRRADAADGTRIDQPGVPALDGSDLRDARLVVVAAAHQVVVAGAGERLRVVGIVHQEQVAVGQGEGGVLAVVTDHAVGLGSEPRHVVEVTGVVAVYDVHRQFVFLQHTQRGRGDHVAAVQHRFRSVRLGVLDRGAQQAPVVVRVGEDADFHQKAGLSAALR